MFDHIGLTEFTRDPWAILPEDFAALLPALARTTAETLAAATSRPPSPARTSGTVAVVPLGGVIFPRGGSLFAEFFGGTIAERFAATLRQAAANADISAIVLDVNSPGGSVAGIAEAADAVRDATTQKPVVAVANHLAASAAYWLASAASELLVTPSGEVGSIGVFAAHQDISGALEQAGVKVNLISAGRFKTEGNPYTPLSDEARAAIQASVDRYYEMFVRDVARGRNATPDEVKAGFGEGRTVGAQDAKRLGMVDAIGTLDDGIRRAAQLARRGGQTPAAELEFRQRRARAAAQE